MQGPEIDSIVRDPDLPETIKLALMDQALKREQFREQSELDRKKWRASTPLVLALTGGITIGLNFLFDSLREDQKSLISQEQAAKQFQYEILQSELEKYDNSEDRARVLLFLANAGLLDDLNVDYLRSAAEDTPDAIPQLGRIIASEETNSLAQITSVDDILQVLLRNEGGFVDHPSDPEGASNQGVTLAAYRQFFGAEKTVEDLKNIPPEHVKHIYEVGYINKVQARKLESVYMAAALVDAAVNSGPQRAAVWLQEVAGELADGTVGPVTLKAINDMTREDERRTVLLYNCRRQAYLRGMSAYRVFGRGWTQRIEDLTPGSDLSVCGTLLAEAAN